MARILTSTYCRTILYRYIVNMITTVCKTATTSKAWRSSNAWPTKTNHNSGWQRDLSVSYERVGDVLVAQGKLQEALDDYQQCLVISKRLAEQDKSNSGWQRDLIVSLYKVGLVRAKIKGSDNIKQAQGLLRTGLKTA